MPSICEGFIHRGAMQREEKKRYWGLFGYGVFFYVWERVIGGFEGVSFGIENSGYFFSSFFFFCRCSWCLQSHGMVVGLVKSRASCKGSFPFMVS